MPLYTLHCRLHLPQISQQWKYLLLRQESFSRFSTCSLGELILSHNFMYCLQVYDFKSYPGPAQLSPLNGTPGSPRSFWHSTLMSNRPLKFNIAKIDLLIFHPKSAASVITPVSAEYNATLSAAEEKPWSHLYPFSFPPQPSSPGWAGPVQQALGALPPLRPGPCCPHQRQPPEERWAPSSACARYSPAQFCSRHSSQNDPLGVETSLQRSSAASSPMAGPPAQSTSQAAMKPLHDLLPVHSLHSLISHKAAILVPFVHLQCLKECLAPNRGSLNNCWMNGTI